MEQSQKHRTLNVFVSGKVQGVGFRRFAQKKARALGLGGWARNLADGRVEITVTGPSGALERFLEDLRRGPLMGNVTGLETRDADGAEFADFEVRPDA